MSKKNALPVNPNELLTKKEEEFINRNRLDKHTQPESLPESKEDSADTKSNRKRKPITLTMPIDFQQEVKDFVNSNPHEGSVSALIYKATYEYIQRKKKEA